MKIVQILDIEADLKEEWGEYFINHLELNGKLQKEYSGVSRTHSGDTQINFECGPETTNGYMSDSVFCDEWLSSILKPLKATLFPDGCLSIHDAENSHSIYYFHPAGANVTDEQAEEIWKAIEAKIDEEFDKLPDNKS